MQSIQSFISRRRDSEEGFTLIELMVVVLIIAILIAIAIPQFLGARQRAQDSAAKSDLRNALTAEKTAFTDTQTYSSDVAVNGVLDSIEPSLTWVSSATPAAGEVAVNVGAVGTVAANLTCLEGLSKSGSKFSIADVAVGTSAGTYYNKGACSTTVGTVAAWTGW